MKITNAEELKRAVQYELITWEQVFNHDLPDVKPIMTHRKDCRCVVGVLETCGDNKDVDCYRCKCELCVPEWMCVDSIVFHNGELCFVKAVEKKSSKKYAFENMIIQLHKSGNVFIDVPASSVKQSEAIPLNEQEKKPGIILDDGDYYILSKMGGGYFHEGEFYSFQQMMDKVPQKAWARYKEKIDENKIS